jgi:tetratricopeptide (TPR) repeat protein
VDEFMAARRAGDVERAVALVAEALTLARAGRDVRDLVRALKADAQIYRDTDRPESAIAPYEEAVALYREDGDPLGLAHTVRHLGDVMYELDRHFEADIHLTEAVTLYRENDGAHELDLANAVRPLAILREAQGRFDEAVDLWAEARDRYDAVGIRAGVQEAENHLTRLRSP